MSLTAVNHPDINRIVGRLHVSESILSVVREVKSKLKWSKLRHHERRYAIAAAIQAHRSNREMYAFIVHGARIKGKPARYWFRKSDGAVLIKPEGIHARQLRSEKDTGGAATSGPRKAKGKTPRSPVTNAPKATP